MVLESLAEARRRGRKKQQLKEQPEIGATAVVPAPSGFLPEHSVPPILPIHTPLE